MTCRVPAVIQPIFCGAALCANIKKGGGIRPIAVAYLPRLIALKAADKAVTAKMAVCFLPVQVGFGPYHVLQKLLTPPEHILQPGEGLYK